MSLKEALENFAQKLRDSNAVLLPHPPPPQHVHPMNVNAPFYPPHPLSSTAPPTNIYSSVSPSTTQGTAPLSPTTMSSPNTTHSIINSPEKRPKAIPPPSQQGQAPSAPATSPAVSTASTPVTVNASLKRKQTGDASSPTLSIEQPPPKSKSRKRGRTGTTGAG